MCEGVTYKEVTGYDCQSASGTTSPIKMSDDLNAIAAGMFFQGLAGNSHRQAVCRANFFGVYDTDETKRTTLNAAAKTQFDSIQTDLHDLLVIRNRYQANYDSFSDPRYSDRAMFNEAGEGRARATQQIKETDEQIAKLLLSVPMGYDPDVSRALIAMDRKDGAFDVNAFQQSMDRAKEKYYETARYYEGKASPVKSADGTMAVSYCMGLDYKNLAGSSGELDRWLTTLPTKTSEDKSFHDKLQCQLQATYGSGQKTLTTSLAVASFAAMLIPGVGEGEIAATATARAIMGVAGTVRVGAAVDLLMTMNSLREECFRTTTVMSGDIAVCDPEKEFAKSIEEPKTSACAMGAITLAALPIGLRTAIQELRAARGAKKAVAAAAGDVSVDDAAAGLTEDIVVTGRVKKRKSKPSDESITEVGTNGGRAKPAAKTPAKPGATDDALEIGESATGISSKPRTLLERLDPKLARQRAEREFIKHYEPKVFVDENQNARFIAAVEKIPPPKNLFIVRSENAFQKFINGSRGRSFGTAVTNFHKQQILRRMTELKARNEGLNIELLPFSDFKAFAYAFKIEGKVPPDIEAQIRRMIELAGEDFELGLRQMGLVRNSDTPAAWFKAGMDTDADKADAYARVARDLPDGTGVVSKDTPFADAIRDGYYRALERSRRQLEQAPGLQRLMQGIRGRRIPARGVFNLARKYKSDTELAAALSKRFPGTNVSAGEAKVLREYINAVDFHNATLRNADRTIVELNDAELGGYSIDLRNVGPAGQEDLAIRLLEAKSMDDAMRIGRASEKAMTAAIRSRLQALRRIVGDVAKCSGDDCVAAATAVMSKSDKQKLVERLAADPETREIRLGFVGDKVRRASDRSVLASDAENIEKAMRTRLEDVLDPHRVDSITFGIDMDSRAVGRGSVSWIAGVHGPPLTASEAAAIDRALSAATNEYNSIKAEDGIRRAYSVGPAKGIVDSLRRRIGR